MWQVAAIGSALAAVLACRADASCAVARNEARSRRDRRAFAKSRKYNRFVRRQLADGVEDWLEFQAAGATKRPRLEASPPK